MPRLGESMQFLQWVEMFLAWMEFRCERLRPLLDPTGQMLPPAAPAAATTEQASARSGVERALHAALVLATGPVSGERSWQGEGLQHCAGVQGQAVLGYGSLQSFV